MKALDTKDHMACATITMVFFAVLKILTIKVNPLDTALDMPVKTETTILTNPLQIFEKNEAAEAPNDTMPFTMLVHKLEKKERTEDPKDIIPLIIFPHNAVNVAAYHEANWPNAAGIVVVKKLTID